MIENDLSIFKYDESTTLDVALEKLRLGLKAFLLSLEREVILSNEVAHLKVKLFGSSSEKRTKQPDPLIFDEAKASHDELANDTAIAIATETLDQATQATQVKVNEKQNKSNVRKPLPTSYPRVMVIHDICETEKTCGCGHPMTRIGAEVTEQLEIVPAFIRVIQHQRLKYACKCCQEGVKIGPIATQAVPKCMAAPGLLAHVATLKFDDHLPLYRQSEIWKRMGVELSRGTLSAWILKTGSALMPLITYLQQHLINGTYIKADETPVQVLKTPGKSNTSNSYLWVYVNGSQAKPAVVYDYQTTRHGEHAKAFLNGFQGVLQTDGFQGYHAVTNQAGVTGIGCWAHARRKFYNVWKLAQTEGVASKALDIISKLYAIEVEIKDQSVDEKLKVRQEKSKVIVDAFYKWLTEIRPNVQPKGGLDKAITYAMNQKEPLSDYLTDGTVEIDNNLAERCIKPFAVGRKNWLFMGSPNGARAGATLLSLIETAKLNGLNPEGYLTHVLSHRIDANDEALIERLMPWNVSLSEEYPPPEPSKVQEQDD